MKRIVLLTLAMMLTLVGVVSADEAPDASLTEAIYEVKFTSNWSSSTHPNPNMTNGNLPGSAHWSSFVGGTHNASAGAWAWEEGGMASPGLERVAELGSSGVFLDEISADPNAFGNFNIGVINTGLGMVSSNVTVDANYPLITIASMIAPSPDWFVGVSSVNLRPGGSWASEIIVTVYPIDAGTEEGTDYSLSNPATSPHEPIADISGMYVFSNEPIGQFTFTRQTPSAVTLAQSSTSTAPSIMIYLAVFAGLLVLSAAHSVNNLKKQGLTRW